MKPLAPRALVVEDEPSWQQILSEVLGDSGLQVDTADSLPAALERLHAGVYRLALVDLSLQADDPHNEDGLRVLEAIRRSNPQCAFILLTGFATVELAVLVLNEYHALSCLRKEAFQRSQLRDLVRQVLAAPPESHGAEARPASTRTRAFDTGESSDGAGLVLVVEDDAGWRSIYQELLRDAGFSMRLCAGYGEALGMLRHERFTLAVVDLSLNPAVGWDGSLPSAELEGYRLLRATRELGVPTLVVSGVSSPDEIERAYREGEIFSYMEKQAFDRRTFTRLVKDAVQAGHAASHLGQLTVRELEVLRRVAQGKTNKEMALELTISENTVKRHVKAIFRKLGIHTRAAAAAKLAGMGEEEPRK